MNCKPGQLAWIKVPPHFCRHGIEKLNNRVVKTEQLLPQYAEPMWRVTPPLIVEITGKCWDSKGNPMQPGDVGSPDGILDAWLRPFDPKSAPETETTEHELGVPA